MASEGHLDDLTLSTVELHLGICTQLFNLHEDWLECTWRVYLA